MHDNAIHDLALACWSVRLSPINHAASLSNRSSQGKVLAVRGLQSQPLQALRSRRWQLSHRAGHIRYVIEHCKSERPASPRASSKQMQRPSADDRALRCMRLFRLFLVRQFYEIGLALNVRITNPDSIIVRIRSSACNHGPVLRGCMIMQSTTCQSIVRSDSLSPINRLRRYRPSCIDVSVCVCRCCRSSRSRAERPASPRRAVNKCNDQARMAEPSVHAIVPLDFGSAIL